MGDDPSAQGVGLELRRAGKDPAALIDDRRDPGIGRAQEIAAGLARPHARDLEVLVGIGYPATSSKG